MRKLLSALAVATLSATAVAVPAASGHEPSASAASKETSFGVLCHAQVTGMGVQDDKRSTGKMSVTGPEQVTVGEEFSLTIEAKSLDLDLKDYKGKLTPEKVSRFKLDFELPEEVEFVEASLDNSGNLQDAHNSRGEVFLVNEKGKRTTSGKIIRYASRDNAVIAGGTNYSNSTHGGLEYNPQGNLHFSFKPPMITLTLKAKKKGNYKLALRHSNGAATYNNPSKNFLTALASAKVPLFGTKFATASCAPNDSKNWAALNLFTITAKATETSVSFGEFTPDPSHKVQVPLTTTPAGAGGKVCVTGENIEKTCGTVNDDGNANVYIKFPVGDTKLTAHYAPSDANLYANSSSEPQTFTAEAQPPAISIKAGEASINDTFRAIAFVDPGADGTVTFFFEDNPDETYEASLINGTASVDIPAGDEEKTRVLSAFYTPSEGAPFKKTPDESRPTAEVKVVKLTHPRVVLSGLEGDFYPGEAILITATLQVPDGISPAGKIRFTADGFTTKKTLEDKKATLDFVPDRDATFPITATYVPDDSQAESASSSGNVTVKPRVRATVTATPPETVTAYMKTAAEIQVDPKINGTATAVIDGENVTVPVENGIGILEFTPKTTAERTVTVHFTPEDPNGAVLPSNGIFTINPVIPTISAATVTVKTDNDKVTADTDVPVTVTVDASTSGIEKEAIDGTAILIIDGEEYSEKVSIIDGQGRATVRFKLNGPHSIKASFIPKHQAEGFEKGSITTTDEAAQKVTVTGGIDPAPADAAGQNKNKPMTLGAAAGIGFVLLLVLAAIGAVAPILLLGH